MIQVFVLVFENYIKTLTRKQNKIIRQTTPITASQSLVSPMCSKTLCQVSMNFPLLIRIPRISFTWLVAIIIAAADVNPTDTGPDIKSMRNPVNRKCLFIFLHINFFIELEKKTFNARMISSSVAIKIVCNNCCNRRNKILGMSVRPFTVIFYLNIL